MEAEGEHNRQCAFNVSTVQCKEGRRAQLNSGKATWRFLTCCTSPAGAAAVAITNHSPGVRGEADLCKKAYSLSQVREYVVSFSVSLFFLNL